MNNKVTHRWSMLIGASLTALALAACERPVTRDPDAEPPPGGDPVTTVVPDIDPNDPNNPNPTPPPPDPAPPADACPLADGRTVNCVTDLAPDAYCASVYPAPAEVGAPIEPDFALVAGCGACNAAFYQPPAGVVCENQPGGVDPGEPVAPPPGWDVLPESTCATCHAPNKYDGNNSIENPHGWATLDCVSCHGGDGTATNPTFAHVCPPPAIGNRQQQVLDTRAFFLSFTTDRKSVV